MGKPMGCSMKQKAAKYILNTIVLSLALVLAGKLAGPPTLRLYVESGIGSCEKIPILCMVPYQEIVNPAISQEYISGLLPYKFPKMEILLPKGFSVTQERVKKAYYKKKGGSLNNGALIYLFHEEKGFFINLFPRLRKEGISDDYEFIKRIMYANEKDIKNLTDVFFVIMKSIFTPDLGGQNNAVMATFSMEAFRGFINYNLSKPNQYFDCNIINSTGAYFKVYIKDIAGALDLNKVLAIITTIKETGQSVR